jgi:hypothetical protein
MYLLKGCPLTTYIRCKTVGRLAYQKGLPYQTYIKSLLHETLVEREKRTAR